MQRHVRENGLSEKPRQGLVCQRTAKGYFASTDLLKFYLDLGVVVEKIEKFYEYIPTTDTGKFSDLVIHYRKEGDKNKDIKCTGDNWKLAGNSFYGEYCNVYA